MNVFIGCCFGDGEKGGADGCVLFYFRAKELLTKNSSRLVWQGSFIFMLLFEKRCVLSLSFIITLFFIYIIAHFADKYNFDD